MISNDLVTILSDGFTVAGVEARTINALAAWYETAMPGLLATVPAGDPLLAKMQAIHGELPRMRKGARYLAALVSGETAMPDVESDGEILDILIWLVEHIGDAIALKDEATARFQQ